jgi:hypothetical protein
MPLEYEYRYKTFNKQKVLTKLKELGSLHQGTWLFRVQVFIHPNEVHHTYIRVRDEGYRIAMTYKYINSGGTHFPIKNEVQTNKYSIFL